MPFSVSGLYYEHGARDEGGPLAVLLHGLSGTGAVWSGLGSLLDSHWPGRWVAPDFRGHGRSPHAERYGIAMHAADIAASIGNTDDVYLIGHSMGGQCAMVLANGWFGFTPKAVITIGVAVDWDEQAKARIDKLVDTPPRYFATDAEARERFVLVNGLKGLVDPASDIAASGVREEDSQWRLSADNRAAMVANASTRVVHGAAVAPVILARGDSDPMVTHQEHASLDPDCIDIAGCGHNVHVEQPQAVWELLKQTAGV
jgi:pimeloyl-ACP methyl ester carboxylesterase